MNDYERIARVIRYLDEHHTKQPDLNLLARQVELSPFHFQRLFTNWAGVTPKSFLQCLTLAQVKESLRRGASVLDSALEAGLSGPGRLHDLCVKLEAASPGEMKAGGAEWTIVAGFALSPFGTCLVAESCRGLCRMSFVEDGDENAAWAGLERDWPNARLRRNDSAAAQIVEKIFSRSIDQDSRPVLRAFVKGTAFQVRVWRALLEIPPGQFTSYGRLATLVGQPTAARAIGTAVGQNPLAYLIPCHRVIRETGVIGNYHWGRVRKQAILAWETARNLPGPELPAADRIGVLV